MRRVLTTWLLLVALGLPLVQPASGSWRCPNGTLCVAGPGGRYHCAGGACRMACCKERGGNAGAGCGSLCLHGALPTAERAAGSSKTQAGIGCTCHFTATARIAAAALTRTQPDLPDVAALCTILPNGQDLPGTLHGVGHLPVPDASPPPDPGLPSIGPRAPPLA